jgi:DnaJ-class molecular chaperone
MWRWLIAFAIVSVGCVASLPSDPSISADLAVETARMVIASRAAPPAPTPDAGQCQNCKGTGKVRSGDGIEVFTCPECNGTGKPVKSVLHPAAFVPCKECEL